MRIGICDDDEIQLNYIKSKLEEWSKTKHISSEIKLFRSAEAFLFEHPESFPFDLLILDIQMGKMSGMELARQIRAEDKSIYLLFLTGLKEYVFEGYEVGAQRYLLKPIKEDQLFSALDDIDHRFHTNQPKYYIFQYAGEMLKVEECNIISIEALGHYLKMTTVNQIYEWKYSIGQIAKELGPDLITVHRSYIVNIKYIEKINKSDLLLSNGLSVPVSRNQYQGLNEAFIRYYKGDIRL
ncbi:MAG: two component transcriptional regulator, LytTR family [Herbinix sp.]|jgi:DNA-binding LytR/AlgR family response regulator|nr:two component transcriptional regulator, LytTR family [Herbinix sp.]